ncbi:MAG: chloride channel protein [Thermoanaerobacteraceae bacterium]|nr:chloride channel protein [Thermoanaerobacteraceae bacterium]
MSRMTKKLTSRVRSLDQPVLFSLSVFIGIAGGLTAAGYTHLIKLLRWLFTGYGNPHLFTSPNIYLILLPPAGGLLIGLMNYYLARVAHNSYGIPGVIEVISLQGKRNPPRIVAVKSLAAAICIGAGGSAGKQASIAQMGLEIGATIGEKLSLPAEKVKLLVMCGVAAVIGAAYNAPLGGAIFVFEIIAGQFNFNHFSLVTVSSAVAAAVYRGIMGDGAKFAAPLYTFQHPAELPWFILLGLLCGAAGVLYFKLAFQAEALFNALRRRLRGKRQLLIPVLAGLAMGLTFYAVPLSFGRGTAGIKMAINGELADPALMILLLVLKLCGVTLTMGAWSTGAGFRAGLFVGAMLGGTFGLFIHHLAPQSTSPAAVYALVGMAGVFSGFAQAPLTAVVMMSEMTRNFQLIIPLAITSVVAACFSRVLSTETLYTARLIQRGLDVINARRPDILKSLSVREAMVAPAESLPGNMTVREAYEVILHKPHDSYPVIEHNGVIAGIITRENIARLLQEGRSRTRLVDVAVRHPVTLSPGDSLQEAACQLARYGVNHLPVVDAGNRPVGMITSKDIIRAYNRDIERAAGSLPGGKKRVGLPGIPAPHCAGAPEAGMHYYRHAGAGSRGQIKKSAG